MLHKKKNTECASAADFCLTGRVYCRRQRNGYFLRSHEELFNVWIEVSHNKKKKLYCFHRRKDGSVFLLVQMVTFKFPLEACQLHQLRE